MAYEGEDIDVLEGLEPVRKRPGMFIGGTGKTGLHHLLWEVLDNSVDEVANDYADEIEVILHEDGQSATITDDGRGIPVDEHPEHEIPALELILTTLHAGGKFNSENYITAGGLHGVGVSVVNALSKKLVAEVKRDGKKYRQEFERGEPTTDLEVVSDSVSETGTSIYFEPDPDIFESVDFDVELIFKRLEVKTYLNKGLKIHFKNEKDNEETDIENEDGIVGYLGKIIDEEGFKTVHDKPFVLSKDEELDGPESLDIALHWTEAPEENIYTFVNGIPTEDGGTHEQGLKAVVKDVVESYMDIHDIKPKRLDIKGKDTREGLVAVVNLFMTDPQFQGQTKDKLNNPSARSLIMSSLRTDFEQHLNDHPSVGKDICERVIQAAKARKAKRSTSSGGGGGKSQSRLDLPGKLADCSSNDPAESELFLVEGDSAGGCFSGETKIALADGRDLEFKEIVKEQEQGKEHYCYTILDDGKVALQKFKNARMTKEDVIVLKITLDNGKEVVCTPDHKFMLEDGSYKKAKNLSESDSLMPLCRKMSSTEEKDITIDGYEMTWDPKLETWIFTHKLADWYNIRNGFYGKNEGDHCHHKDFDKLNNNPTNIERLSEEEHFELHQKHLKETLHSEEAKQRAREAHQNDDYRERMSERMKQPETREKLSEQAKEQWEDEDYKEYMKKKWREFYNNNEEYRKENKQRLIEESRKYWSDQKHREEQSERIEEYYENNPEAKEKRVEQAKKLWDDEELLEWRSQKTKEQWTDEFRQKRKEALNETYFEKTITKLNELSDNGSVNIEKYNEYRLETGDSSCLRFDTFCDRYFDGDEEKAKEAVLNYNHNIKKIEVLDEKIDVYDAEVPKTHNFALGSGVFVHNSAKQARDRETQAVLPLRGKVLNSERASKSRVQKNKELSSVIDTLGCGIGDDFNLGDLRYYKIILLMDADTDGYHISILLLTFFYRYMRPLIDGGFVYMAQPPLYRIDDGQETHWVSDDREKEKVLQNSRTKNPDIQRFKGLGEMMPKSLKETTLDPETRSLLNITVPESDKLLTEQIISQLMGRDTTARYNFIMDHAGTADNIDV